MEPGEGVALETQFRIACTGWIDEDLPLRYKYYYYGNRSMYLTDIKNDKMGNKNLLMDYTGQTYLETALPSGDGEEELFIMVSISDVAGGITNVTQPVRVT